MKVSKHEKVQKNKLSESYELASYIIPRQ